MPNTTNWTLGLDLRDGAEGPLIFARWLQAQLEGAELDALHVIEKEQLSFLASADKQAQAKALAEDALGRTLERCGESSPLAGARFVEGSPVDALAKASAGNTGLILGRLAPRGKDQILRLGSVARRLLRQLPAPSVVVPPDLSREQIGKGPIVLACDAQPDSLGAARYALQLSQQLGRELVLAHVVPMPYGWSVGYLPAESLHQIRADLRANGGRTLERWATEHGLSGRRGLVREGLVAEELARIAKDEDALTIVVGSRKLNAVERLFVASVGSELAASATVPVFVVPPDFGHSETPA